jgi:hypothetical protein
LPSAFSFLRIDNFLKPFSKIGFWFKVPSLPQGFAATREAPTKGLIRLWRVGPKDIVEMGLKSTT